MCTSYVSHFQILNSVLVFYSKAKVKRNLCEKFNLKITGKVRGKEEALG